MENTEFKQEEVLENVNVNNVNNVKTLLFMTTVVAGVYLIGKRSGKKDGYADGYRSAMFDLATMVQRK